MKKKKEKTDQQKKEIVRKKCVVIAKKIAKINAGYRCEFVDENGVRCNRSLENGYQQHGSHIKCENSHKSMSADVDNIQDHCSGHHTGMGNVTPNWHKDPLLMVMLFEKQQPERAKKLNERSWTSKKCDIIFWTKKLAKLTEELAKLEGVDN